jgi:hypothetical protein
MRTLSLLFGVALLFTAACSGNNSVSNPATPTPVASFAGTWVGTATDSTGSMMGSGLGNLATMTWVLAQSGNQVTGTISFAGLTQTPSQAAPTVSGAVSGNTMTFTATMPASSMPPPNLACSASANGTLTMNTPRTSMAGTYSGTSSCLGGFANGQITLRRQ